jgi:site-specific DNA-methyltransferase (adenine-specific)
VVAKVDTGKLEDYRPQRRNLNKHSQRGMGALESSMRKHGYVAPITVAADGEAIDGSARLETIANVFEDDVIVVHHDGTKPVIMVRDDIKNASTNEARAISALANRVAEINLTWDAAELFADMQSGVDFSDAFNQDELDAMLAGLVAPEPEPATDPGGQIDRAEELQEKWQCKAGDIWQIGEHFAICGDCRESETWRRLLQAAGVDKVNGVFTSPPYAMQRKDQYGGVPTAEYVDWWELVQSNVKANLANDGSFFVNIKAHCEDGQRTLYVMELVIAMVRRFGWRWIEESCWKHSGTPKKVDKRFKNQFEPIYQFTTDDKFLFHPESVMVESNRAFKGDGRTLSKHQGVGESIRAVIEPHDGDAYPGNVLSVNFDKAHGQSAAFPVGLPDFFVRAYSDDGDTWCDPFLGSGTTIVATHQNNRKGLGIERLPKYMAVILERLQTVTGCDPVLQ